ncbi:MAG: hypothetical protein MUW57_14630 [Pseudomonas sp.]|nr:hypothetical protein [Pseudomonas sp.]
MFTPPRHERGGFDFVTDKNKQVTHDRKKNAELLVPALGFDPRRLSLYRAATSNTHYLA